MLGSLLPYKCISLVFLSPNFIFTAQLEKAIGIRYHLVQGPPKEKGDETSDFAFAGDDMNLLGILEKNSMFSVLSDSILN